MTGHTHEKKLHLYTNLTFFTKINSKWIIELNEKHKTIKHLENNIGDLGLSDEFLDITPKTQSMKEKDTKLDFIKLKTFCYVKDTVKRMKGQGTDWEKIFAKYIPDKGLLSKIYKELFFKIFFI